MSRTKVFVSYSHVDEEWRARLMTHLAILAGRGLVDLWADTRIRIGTEWRTAIDDELLACQVAVLLVSANFLGSQFIQEVEVKRLLERHEREGLVLLPVIARPCAWRLVDWLAARQCRPENGRALSLGAEPEVDRDLAMLTYEIGMLLGQAGPAATDEMARISSEMTSDAGRLDWLRPTLPASAIPGLAGQSWQGRYDAVSGGSERSMVLVVDSSDGLSFRGRIRWFDESVLTIIEGRLEATHAGVQESAIWAEAGRRAQRPLCTLRFTDVEQQGHRALELAGDYRAILQSDMVLVGLWYRYTTDSTPIGEFALQPVRA